LHIDKEDVRVVNGAGIGRVVLDSGKSARWETFYVQQIRCIYGVWQMRTWLEATAYTPLQFKM
jgi:hypothetical protein